ncbi:unnamed protein product [Notodromas monacha]|uniref:Uncharacterized protein n=1 Tax=Notodromas monacha TaxID=399045 RepID=A0A7R9BYI7_9CRUS|nr:unnamed protein product [Notodromas monacha]CAG0922966.1 unnamed protein product [Notodromas monacha]
MSDSSSHVLQQPAIAWWGPGPLGRPAPSTWASAGTAKAGKCASGPSLPRPTTAAVAALACARNASVSAVGPGVPEANVRQDDTLGRVCATRSFFFPMDGIEMLGFRHLQIIGHIPTGFLPFRPIPFFPAFVCSQDQ